MTPKAMHNPIIIALDVESAADARALIQRLGRASTSTRSAWNSTPRPVSISSAAWSPKGVRSSST